MHNNVNKIYYGVFNEDPKIIGKKLPRPKSPIPTYNLNKIYELIILNSTQYSDFKKLSVSN